MLVAAYWVFPIPFASFTLSLILFAFFMVTFAFWWVDKFFGIFFLNGNNCVNARSFLRCKCLWLLSILPTKFCLKL
ncbi:hypothetical protein PC118_g9624 [Phytophthora cactorum]|uniref:Uncharacterized protein n=1 Tax=Phytophthora cactorum TaxID=29920 RepID=A0A8T1CL58_9STRA|nr:hypothetical protein PC111_g8408 [Phytophthora cactorum]KAG2858434.1 hypothetical protein PC113_g9819 [Phytophthora cactorum]KAG2925601.1 hypothetical protein PC117_g15150 [Phytophthora cactorum]KAG2983084.1 hypothetical protein PC118_g9624 [Phytophthora cactorum]KAG3020597.1 hypothetical protein PC120_g9215 [Phytophthora cactorum]